MSQATYESSNRSVEVRKPADDGDSQTTLR